MPEATLQDVRARVKASMVTATKETAAKQEEDRKATKVVRVLWHKELSPDLTGSMREQYMKETFYERANKDGTKAGWSERRIVARVKNGQTLFGSPTKVPKDVKATGYSTVMESKEG